MKQLHCKPYCEEIALNPSTSPSKQDLQAQKCNRKTLCLRVQVQELECKDAYVCVSDTRLTQCCLCHNAVEQGNVHAWRLVPGAP